MWKKAKWREIAIGVSLVNLCFLRVWTELLTYTPAQSYEMRLPPGPSDYLAVCLNVAVWGSLLGLLGLELDLAGYKQRPAAQWAFLLLLLVPLNALRSVLASHLPVGQQYLKGGLYAALGPAGLAVFGTVIAAGGAFALRRWRESVFHAARAVLLALLPCVPLTLLQAAWKARHYDPRPFADQPAPRPFGDQPARRPLAAQSDHRRFDPAKRPAGRVVWVIFDEWDQRLTFDDRLEGLALPEIDRFRSQSLAAGNAYPPAPATLESMPSLISGRIVHKAVPAGPSELRLTFVDGGPPAQWRDLPNVFGVARALGFETALAGVYHPYCRVLARDLTSCWWAEMPRPINSSGETLGALMLGQTRSLLESWRLSAFGQSLSTRRKAREFSQALARAQSVAADPSYGLVLVHLLTPHFPHAYDRATRDFTLGNAPFEGYYDSLALTDLALGELRRAMEAAGTWESTAVLLSSDHALRHAALLDGKSDSRVPFLLKLAGQAEMLTYEPEFNTVITRDLLIEVLQGRFSGPRHAARWLDGHRHTKQGYRQTRQGHGQSKQRPGQTEQSD